MSSLTLITGTIDEAEDPFFKLNTNELYYEKWEEDHDDPENVIISRELLPVRFFGHDQFRVSQYLGSGKTLKAMDILTQKVYFGGRVTANLGLIWDNEGKPKDDWVSGIQSLDDFKSLSHCTALLDDIKGTILKWNTKEADFIAEIMNAGRKLNLDIVITAQREKQIPPDIRDIATDWIVPIIRVRDYTRPTPDNTGYPVEMVSLHFDGGKVFKYMSEPLIGLEPLFDAYSTLQRAIVLREGEDKARCNQPGYNLEAKAFEFLKEKVPGMEWQHLNGKHVFDIISDTHAIDIVGTDPDGALILEHKDLAKHMRTAKRQGQKPYLMFSRANEWILMQVTPNLSALVEGKRIQPDRIANNRFKTLEKAMGI